VTVGVTGSRFAYAGDGSTRAFSFPRLFLDPTHLRVVRRTSAGVETTLVYGVNYSVTGTGNVNGGTVTLSTAPAGPPGGETVIIWRETQRHQSLDLENGGAFSATNIEGSFDKIYLIIDDVMEQLSRKVGFGMGQYATPSVNLPPIVPGGIIAWDDTGSGLTNRTAQQWLYGTGAPAGSLGKVGDFYIDSVTGDYYFKTGPAAWEQVGTIKGAQGEVGPEGPPGPEGDPWSKPIEVGTTSGSVTISYTPGKVVRLTLGANVTSFTITNWPTPNTLGRLLLEIYYAGSYGINSWPAAVRWPADAVPALSSEAGKSDSILLWTTDGGSTVKGAAVGFNFNA
jgi:hypothetical protein